MSLVWSFDKLIERDHDQSSYGSDVPVPFDDSNYAKILSLGEGRPNKIDLSGYEIRESVRIDVEKETREDVHPL